METGGRLSRALLSAWEQNWWGGPRQPDVLTARVTAAPSSC